MYDANYRADLIGLSVFWALLMIAVINLGISHNSAWIERLGLLALLCGALAFGMSAWFNLAGLEWTRSAGRALAIMCFLLGLLAWALVLYK